MMRYEDEIEDGDEVVRPFMATKGRVRTDSKEYPVETLVNPTAAGRLNAANLNFEQKRIINEFSETIAIIEISAQLELPLRAAQILVSEMIDEGLVYAHRTVTSAGNEILLRIRAALTAL